MIHDELTSADGLTMYVSFARNNWPAGGDYRTYLRRFNLASPVNEWMGTDGARTLVIGDQSGVGVRQGLAFFASEVPLPGYAAVYAFDAQPPLAADRMYGLDVVAPAGYTPAGVAFYAPRYARPASTRAWHPCMRCDFLLDSMRIRRGRPRPERSTRGSSSALSY